MTKKCVKCGRELKDPESIKRGMGSICAKKPTSFLEFGKSLIDLKILPFDRFYYKFGSIQFTTIREKEKYKKYSLDELVRIQVNSQDLAIAKIVSISIRKISDIPLEIIQSSTHSKNFFPNSKWQFVEFMNEILSVNGYESEPLNINSEICLFYLMRLSELNPDFEV